jgi:hypothetical protein
VYIKTGMAFHRWAAGGFNSPRLQPRKLSDLSHRSLGEGGRYW